MEKPMAQSKVVARKQKAHHLPMGTLQAIDGVETLVNGCEVSLAPASKYYKKHWEIYSEIVKDHATRTSPVTYLLSERLLNATGRQLLRLSKDEKNRLGHKPSDFLAAAMCKAALESDPQTKNPMSLMITCSTIDPYGVLTTRFRKRGLHSANCLSLGM